MKQLKKSIICFLLLLLIPILLSGCQNSITQGEVIEKEFTPSHTEVMLVHLFTATEKHHIQLLYLLSIPIRIHGR